MKKKLIGFCVIALVLALLLTLTPACGNGDDEVETLKIGFIGPLSGAAAGWGVSYVAGEEWAVDRINEAGGFKVGDTTYMLELVTCDDKITGSESTRCAAFMVDQGVSFTMGPIGTPCTVAIRDVLNDGKVFNMDCGYYVTPTSEYPYRIQGFPVGSYGAWIREFDRMFLKAHPEVKTVALMNVDYNWADWHVNEVEVAEELGLDVVAEESYDPAVQDFYPILTRILPKNPDAIGMESSPPGYMALIIKQARELGYEGLFFAPNAVLPELLIPVTGEEAAEGFYCNQADYSDPMWPEETRALYADYQSFNPDIEMFTTTMQSWVGVHLYIRAMQEAGSTDPDAVLEVIQDPDFTFNYFGYRLDAKLGGRDFYGYPGVLPMPNAMSTFIDGELVQLDIAWTEVP